MIFNLLKKIIKFKSERIDTNIEELGENNSLLLAVPLYFYLDFLKIYYKSILLCFISITGLLLAYLYAPTYNLPKKVPSLPPWSDPSETKQNSESTHIQTHSPVDYEEMLQELRKMQQAAAFLQIKQQASDRKTLALQHQIQKLQMKTKDSDAGIISERRAQNMIKEALMVYDADKLGLRDYALENLGGQILSTPFTTAALNQIGYVVFGLFNFHTYSNPRTIIQPEVHAGNCFRFEGTSGRIRIKLSNEILISAVTLEHVSISLLTPEELQAAPKNFQIHGLFTEHTALGYPLGQFTYAIDGPPRQTFLIINPKEAKSYEIIEFEILNNYGNENYTCVYRLRVHGQLVN